MQIKHGGLHEVETLISLFQLVERCVSDSGGDGWGTIACHDYRALAEFYQEYSKTRQYPFDVRHEDSAGISFYRDQAVVRFTGDLNAHHLLDEIFVCLPWAVTLE